MWLAGLATWRLAPIDAHLTIFAAIDIAIVAIFYQLARRRWFPVPLVFLHAVVAALQMLGAAIGAHESIALKIALNRAYEMSLVYVAGCVSFRIAALSRRRVRAV